MDIFFNIGLFTTGLNIQGHPPRGLLHRDDQVDIFKYCLSSLTVLDQIINNVYIYIELEEVFKSRSNELQEYTQQLFGNKLHYYNYRNIQQKQWQDACNRIESDLIWFSGNHDHFFIDSSTYMLLHMLYILNSHPDKCKSVFFSSLPAMLIESIPYDQQYKNIYSYTRGEVASVQIINYDLLHFYWFNQNYNRTFRRTDERGYCVQAPPMTTFVPPKELWVHYDGYDIPGHYPAYVIPPGFFDNNIKIRYGYSNRREDCVNINPSAFAYSDIDPNGTDYKWVLADIPLFWQDKITDIDINPQSNHDKLLEDRNTALLYRMKSKRYFTGKYLLNNNLTDVPAYNEQLGANIENYIKKFDPLFGETQ